jgi:hypothetical protein
MRIESRRFHLANEIPTRRLTPRLGRVIAGAAYLFTTI